MITFFETVAILAASAAVVDAAAILMPPSVTTGEEIAIVWIHGADCDNAAY